MSNLPLSDPRHGKVSGYNAGCHSGCCREARTQYARDYRRVLRITGRPRLVTAVGTHRRLQALMAIGWAKIKLCAELGRTDTYLDKTLAVDMVRQSTRDEVAALYERLLTQPVPQSWWTPRLIEHARAMDWPPPSEWDDIDDPDELPMRVIYARAADPCLGIFHDTLPSREETYEDTIVIHTACPRCPYSTTTMVAVDNTVTLPITMWMPRAA